MAVSLFRPRGRKEEAPIPSKTKPRRRGALTNPAIRFESRRTVAVDPDDPSADDASVPAWRIEGDRAESEPPPTRVLEDKTRTIVARNDSPDVPFDRSVNPYRGCEHGCVYCFARPTHAYLGLSPGLDFETTILAKPRAAELLRRELSKPAYRCEPIAIGSNTDPYQPVERNLKITRSVLEVLREFRHPVSVVTKSALVLRDLDLLAPMASDGLAKVFLSITTLDPELARRMEPRAASPSRRLEAVRGLAAAGVPVGVLASPMIPGLNDHELESILAASAERGATSANYLLVRLPHEVKALFLEWLDANAPARAGKILALLREVRGGELTDPRFGSRMSGEGAYADLLRRRFEVASRRHGLSERSLALDTSRFRAPDGAQQRLFG